MTLSLFILHLSHSLLEWVEHKLQTVNAKIDQTDLTGWMSWRKSTLIQRPLTQIPKAFHLHEIAEKSKMIQCECFNIDNRIAHFY